MPRSLFRHALPRWVSIVVGVLCVGLGLYLLTRPLTSLTTLAVLIGLACLAGGVADLIAATRSATPRVGVVAAVGWIVLGMVILVWLGYTINLLAPVAAVALAVSGIIRLVRAARGGTVDERIATALFGVADLVFAVVAWRWPDVTLLVLAFLFGIRLIFLGVARIWAGLRRTGDTEPTEPRGAFTRSARVVGAVLALVVALAAAGVASRLDEGRPSVDAFYTPPTDVAQEPGHLLRAEPFTQGIPDSAKAWRILYTTTRDEGQPAVASGIVMVSDDAPPGPRPVIAWAHGTTGFARPCGPSLLDEPFVAGALPAEAQLLDRGWALVATDYIGLGTAGPHPYLIGQGEGRSVLDAVRAAHQHDQLDVADETVVWGHSQGGHAALWTGVLAPTYAPEVDIVGVAAIAPASDVVGLADHLGDVTGGSVFGSYIVVAYTDTYPDVDSTPTFARRPARWSARCRSAAWPNPECSSRYSPHCRSRAISRSTAPTPRRARSGNGSPRTRPQVPCRSPCCSPRAKRTHSLRRACRPATSPTAAPTDGTWTTAPTRARTTWESSATIPT